MTSTLKIGSAIQASVVVEEEEEEVVVVVVKVPVGMIKKILKMVERATKVQVGKTKAKVRLDKIPLVKTAMAMQPRGAKVTLDTIHLVKTAMAMQPKRAKDLVQVRALGHKAVPDFNRDRAREANQVNNQANREMVMGSRVNLARALALGQVSIWFKASMWSKGLNK